MSATKTNLLQGTLDLLILKALGPGELHGLDISRRIEQITKGTLPTNQKREVGSCIRTAPVGAEDRELSNVAHN